MENLQTSGLVKNIGPSNWNCQGLRTLMSYAKIKQVACRYKSIQI